MKNKMKCFQALLAVTLCISFATVFTSCSDDDESIKANAIGIYLSDDGYGELKEKTRYFWINDYCIRYYDYDGETTIQPNQLRYARNYYPLTSENIYMLINSSNGGYIYPVGELNEDNLGELLKVGKIGLYNMVNRLKSYRAYYRYISTSGGGGDYFLFNRVSEKNYN